MRLRPISFFLTDPPPTDTSTLSLHDALPIWGDRRDIQRRERREFHRDLCDSHSGDRANRRHHGAAERDDARRSEEHTSELQSHSDLVCRLLLEKKKNSAEMLTMPHATPDEAA